MLENLLLQDSYKRALLHHLHRPAPLSHGSTVVFAPHQDDETLGCGGTIIQKRRAGVPVWIVFMTDGSRSHEDFMSNDELCALRRQEALNAGRVMGVPEEQIHFLRFPNGELRHHQAEAQQQVKALLSEIGPAEVYIPSPWDFHSEHHLTARIVFAALGQLAKEDHRAAPSTEFVSSNLPLVYEYPIWFWNQWPLVSLPSGDPTEASRLIRRGLRYGFGMAFLAYFRYAVSVCQVLDTKRDALAQYASQTGYLNPNPDWATIQDTSRGEFLNFFFQDCEIFRPVNSI